MKSRPTSGPVHNLSSGFSAVKVGCEPLSGGGAPFFKIVFLTPTTAEFTESTSLDFAVLPIGGNYTMDAQDALVAAQMIQCDKIIGVHYNTFPPISIDTEAAKSLFRMANKELLLPAIGESLEF